MRADFLLFTATLVVAVLVLLPGTGGSFMLDDFPNFAGLRAVHADGTLYGITQYVTTGPSSTLGRPVALLSFAAQAASWDTAPSDFIRVNILLHLLNGVLWYGIVLQLQRLGAVPRATVLPAAAMALWLLMPIHGSTALYAVQRMTVLAVVFMLAGTLVYLAGRVAALGGRLRAGFLMSAGVLLAVVPGTLSKEIGALSPLLLLLTEGTLLRDVERPAYWRKWAVLFLWAPAGLLLAYLTFKFPDFLAGYQARTFTLAERLLTESRVLFGYLFHAFVPESSVRLMHDDVRVSTSLLQPWTTLPALAGWLALIGIAVLGARRWPLAAFGIGWYLVGHLLESTFIPLELAFDHRAYLPLLGVTLAVTAWIAGRLEHARPRMRVVVAIGGIGYLAVLAAHTWLAASLWSRPVEQARQWVLRQPDSVRAAQYYGQRLTAQRGVHEASAFYHAARRRWPDDMVLALLHFKLGCIEPAAGISVAEAQAAILRDRGGDVAIGAGAGKDLAATIGRGDCAGPTPDDALALLGTMLQSPRLTTMHLVLHQARALLLDDAGRTAEALDQLDQALAIDAQVTLLQQAIWWSVRVDDLPRATRYLAVLETSPRVSRRMRYAYRREIQGMRQLVELYESVAAGTS